MSTKQPEGRTPSMICETGTHHPRPLALHRHPVKTRDLLTRRRAGRQASRARHIAILCRLAEQHPSRDGTSDFCRMFHLLLQVCRQRSLLSICNEMSS